MLLGGVPPTTEPESHTINPPNLTTGENSLTAIVFSAMSKLDAVIAVIVVLPFTSKLP